MAIQPPSTALLHALRARLTSSLTCHHTSSHRLIPRKLHTSPTSHARPPPNKRRTTPKNIPTTFASSPANSYEKTARGSVPSALLRANTPSTTLFRAPSSRALPLTALAFSCIGFLFAGNMLYTSLLDPGPFLGPSAPWFARTVVLLPGVLGGVVGIYLLNSGRRHLSSISALVVPTKTQSRAVVLDLTPRRLFSPSPGKGFRVELGNAKLAERVAFRRGAGVMRDYRTPQGLAAQGAEALQRDSKLRPAHLTLVEAVGWRINRALSVCRRVYTRDGLLRVYVKMPGRKGWTRFVLDVEDGWCADEGALLEGVCPVQED